eukprot:3544626-Karenia_brevis.AAC.1
MEWRNLCRDKEADRGIFAHNKEEGLRYMENRRNQFLPIFQQLMLMGLPDDAAYHPSDCLELAARDFHPCMRRMAHGRRVVH